MEKETEEQKEKRKKLLEKLNIAFLIVGMSVGLMTAIIHYKTLSKMK